MPKYSYFDASGRKRGGPVTEEELRELAKQGIIRPDTRLRAEDGHEIIRARKISNMEFTIFPKFSTFPWHFDFAAHLFTCRLVFALSCIVAVVLGGVSTYYLFQLFGEANSLPEAVVAKVKLYAIIGISATWTCVIIIIASTRLICEWSLITSKAAQMYVEKMSQEQT